MTSYVTELLGPMGALIKFLRQQQFSHVVALPHHNRYLAYKISRGNYENERHLLRQLRVTKAERHM